jgi:MFS family permease
VTTPDPRRAEPREDSLLKRDLRAIFLDGVSWSVMVGIGETYFAAFVLALGMREVWSGLISTLPLLAGGVLQLFTPWGVTRLRSRRRWVVLCAAIQTVTFLPFVIGALVGAMPGVLVFVTAAAYWAVGMAAGPAWNAWVGQLVPERIRSRYFAWRTWATQVGTLGGLLLGGVLLEVTRAAGRALWGFAALFTIAALARALSARWISSQSEEHPPVDGERRVGVLDLLRRFRHSPDGRLILYLISLTATVNVAGPYFNPYMLKHLMLSYTDYTWLIGASFVAKILALAVLSKVSVQVGPRRLLRAGGFGIMITPALWLISSQYYYLVALQVFSGVCWGISEFATFLLLLETIREDERTSLLTIHNFANSLAMVGGSLLGGVLFAALGQGIDGYRALFIASTLARAAAMILLVRVTGIDVPVVRLIVRTISVRPWEGGLGRPIHSTIRSIYRSGRRDEE